jgi:hypothetical protein
VNTRIEWVLQDFSVQAPVSRYEGGWHATDAEVEQEGQWDSLTAALAWGRARAPVVVLHIWVGSPRRHVTYSAGTSRWQRYLEWHERGDSDAARVERHSGSVQIRESPYDWVPRETFSLMTEVRANGEIETTTGESGLPLPGALELARSRSDFVVVGIIQRPDSYAYFNAGARPAPAETYPPYPG